MENTRLLNTNQKIKIDDKDIFKNDAFKARNKPLIESLTEIMPEKANTPFVMSVNGEWGYGKTSFVELWAAYLRKNGYKTIYFNAWEKDFVENPFLSFVSAFRELKKSDLLRREAKEVAKVMFPAIAKIGTNLLAQKFLGQEVKDIKKYFSDTAGDLIDLLFEEEEQLSKRIEFFKKALCKMAENEKNPIVVFIDELDRCKPSYAVELLEEIKHLFNVEGFIFVLSINKGALGEIVQSHYGLKDIDGYLDRFINFSIDLAQPNHEQFAVYLLQKYKLSTDEGLFKTVFAAMCRIYNISLREQEKLFLCCKLLEKELAADNFNRGHGSDENKKWEEHLKITFIPFILMLKFKKKEIYQKLCQRFYKPVQGDTFCNDFKNSFSKEVGDDYFQHEDEFEILKFFIDLSYYYKNGDEGTTIGWYCSNIIEDTGTGQGLRNICARRYGMPSFHDIVYDIYKKIELLNLVNTPWVP